MNYKQLIIDAANAENWDEVLKICRDAKLNSSEDSIFGIKKGYVNFFRCGYDVDEVKQGLKDYGYKCYDCRLGFEVNLEFINQNYVVLFCGDEKASIGLMREGYPLAFFEIKSREYGKYTYKKQHKKYYYVNSDTQKFRFEKFSDLKGTLREQQIDSILDD